MTEERGNTENAANGPPVWRCIGRLVFTAPMALVCLLLALGDPSPFTVTVLVVGAWLWLTVSVIVAIFQARETVEEATAKQTDVLDFLHGVPLICSWTCLLLLAVAATALFAAGETVLATATAIVLILRMAVANSVDDRKDPNRCASAGSADYMAFTSGPGIIWIVSISGAVWFALGSPPVWVERMILIWFWFLAVGAITVNCLMAAGWIFRSRMEKPHRKYLKRNDVPPEAQAWPKPPPVTPEPPRTGRQQFMVWLWRTSWIVVTWALWTAGQPLLAGLYLLGSVLKLAARTHARRLRHGDTARIDFLARAVHFVVWWPLVITGTAAAVTALAALFGPLIILGTIWDWIAGTTRPQTDREREERIRRVRVRRAAASYRLREAFGQPDGFVYFLYAEPHQKKHFLGLGGLLAGLGEHVVARDWRKDILPARKAAGWTRFQQTPEGALLRVNKIASMQKNMPFIAVVPSRGIVQVFAPGEAYRARKRDKGAALARAEVEIMAAIEAVLKPGAGGAA